MNWNFPALDKPVKLRYRAAYSHVAHESLSFHRLDFLEPNTNLLQYQFTIFSNLIIGNFYLVNAFGKLG